MSFRNSNFPYKDRHFYASPIRVRHASLRHRKPYDPFDRSRKHAKCLPFWAWILCAGHVRFAEIGAMSGRDFGQVSRANPATARNRPEFMRQNTHPMALLSQKIWRINAKPIENERLIWLTFWISIGVLSHKPKSPTALSPASFPIRPTVRTTSQHLSLRPSQKDSLKILDQVFTSFGLSRNKPAVADALAAIRVHHPGMADLEREFIPLCFALAAGTGKQRPDHHPPARPPP
jgi:hypothetical protein